MKRENRSVATKPSLLLHRLWRDETFLLRFLQIELGWTRFVNREAIATRRFRRATSKNTAGYRDREQHGEKKRPFTVRPTGTGFGAQNAVDIKRR